ncbi:MAG: ribosome biogenesis GTPase Der [Pirellulales bacterium]
MGLPQVVIVGRPNVGKSSIFNWLIGKRVAIVDPTAGVTRDRLTHLLCAGDRYFELVDTGGMGGEDSDDLTRQIEEQIDIAIESASVVLFVVDTRARLMPLDEEVARRLRHVKAPVICVANKTDAESMDSQADEFYRLGQPALLHASVQENRGRQALLEMILERLPPATAEDAEPLGEPVMKVAIVGRRNTGKSTFVNTLAHAERMITSEIPGTTRDSVDVRFELDGKSFIAIDTPGLTRRKSIATDLDFYSMHRAQRSIRRADVVFLFMDAVQKISKVDKQLCDYVAEQYRPCVFVVNKWDMVAGSVPTEKWADYVRETFRTLWYVPIAFVTGQTGKNVQALLNLGQMLFKQANQRVATGELNRLVRAAVDYNPPPVQQNRRTKIFYGTQVGVQPPTIVLFCNDPDALTQPYRRYLLGVFREHLPFGEVPIKLYLRRRERAEPGEGGIGEEAEEPAESE